MLGADFAFHLLAKRNDIAVGNNTHFVGFLDATRFIFGGIAGFRAGGNVVDLRRRGVEAVGFDTQKIAFGFECIEQGIQMRLDGGFAAGNDDVARRAFALQAFKDFDNAVLGIVWCDLNGHECRVCGI